MAANDLISVAFGLAGVAIALATYWITRRRNATIPEHDTELALLDSTSLPASPPLPIEELNSATTTGCQGPVPADAHQNNQLHEVIGDALELFSKHLRGRS
ncbi:hypothetical protein BKA61DRAFT_577308 [Leptodontidium sp. MPI-SDFR-AT-0119]|nr:hypothetical protein BKA61DRAFT_577308 [Leptodontidium sp. MPI-SDFR-AT-0119]